MKHQGRPRAAVGWVWLVVLALTVATTSAAFAQSREVVNVYNWADYIDEEVIREFEREFGIRVNYDVFSNNEELHAKLIAGATGYDVIFPTDYMVEVLIEEGLLMPLDHDALPNLKHIDPRFLDAPFDPGNEYSVPYLWGTAGIGVNTRWVKEPVDSWEILWDPKYRGRIAMLNDSREVFGAALKLMGESLNESDLEKLEEAKQLLLQQKPLVLTYDSDNTKNLLLSDEVWLAHGWSGDVLQAVEEDPDIVYVVPKEGTTLWMDNMAIPVGARNPENALKLINFLLRPEISARLSEYTRYPSPNLASHEYTDPEVLADEMIYPPDEVLARAEWMEDLGDAAPLLDRLWTELKAE